MTNEPIVKKKKLFFIVWLMPLLALLLGSWMVYNYYQNKGVEIVITLKDGDGIEVNKTPLLFNGIKLGKVTAIAICPTDISKVDVTVTIPKKAVGIPRQGNMFWKVAPKVSLTEVTGLNALLSGAYLEAMPVIKDIEKVKKLPFQTHFIALDTPPVNTFEPGVTVTLLSDEADLQVGAPVLFKKLPVGRVLKSSLTTQGLQYTLHIDEKYKHLIQNNSIFWKISGIELRASLAGIYVQMDSLASLVTGGIQFDSPPNGQAVTAAQPLFQLFDNRKKMHSLAPRSLPSQPPAAITLTKECRTSITMESKQARLSPSTTTPQKTARSSKYSSNPPFSPLPIKMPIFGLSNPILV